MLRLQEKKYSKIFCFVSRNNPLKLKGLKSVSLKIIQMYHFRLKWKRYTVCTNWWDSNFFGVGLPLFPVGLMGVLNSCFQNPSENSVLTHNGLRRLVVNVNMQYNGCWVAQQTLENGGTKGQQTRKIKRGPVNPFMSRDRQLCQYDNGEAHALFN